MFVISLIVTSCLALASAGHSISGANDLLETDPLIDRTNISRATPRNWAIQKLGVFGVAFSLCGVAGGWGMLCAGGVGYNIYHDHQGAPKLDAGPDLGANGMPLGNRIVADLFIAFFILLMLGGYFYRLRPRMQTEYVRARFSSASEMV